MGAASYNEPVAPPARSPLVTRIEELAKKVRPSLEIDPRLERAAIEIARRAPPSGPPANELVASALWLHGIVEPPPHLIVVTVGANVGGGDEAPLLDELRAQLPRVLSTGNYRRAAAAAEPVGARMNVVVALQESWVELDPVPRSLAADGTVLLKGRVLPPYARPEILVTSPDGNVTRLFVAARTDVTKFSATLHCGASASANANANANANGRGRHQVEITGDDRFGPSVLANFPVDCGLPAPTELVAGSGPEVGRAPVSDIKKAEVELEKLINVDRQRAGLPPLSLDDRLSKVARAHSEDMVHHHFVGHVSPTTGSAADRLRSAHLPAQLVLENVARAYSPGEVERGLMESPGHRANLLSKEVTHYGVGIALGELQSGVREIFATQLFVHAPEALPQNAADELKRRVDDFRRARELPPLLGDNALDEIALTTAEDLAQGKLTQAQAHEPLERALRAFSGRYRSVRTALAVTTDLPQAVTSLEGPLADKRAAALGVGIARGSEAVFVVVLLGSR
jgi:uncharacterized protein YkwD